MPRRRSETPPSHDRWLVSYADFITLLFAFFVVLFASSQSDRSKVRQVSESVQAAFRGKDVSHSVARSAAGRTPKPSSLEPSFQQLLRDLDSEIHTGKMQVKMGDRGLTVSLSQSAFFPSGEDTLDPSTFPILEKVAVCIRKLPNPIRFEGHTDSVPIHTPRYRSNWELSAARAIAVMARLQEAEQISGNRMAVSGYADTSPVDSNDSEAGRARNRRVDIVVLNAGATAREPPGTHITAP